MKAAIFGRTLLLLATLPLARGLAAQPRTLPPSGVVSASRLKHLVDSLTPLGSKSAPLGAGPSFTYAIWHRDTSGGLERHEAWNDILIVQSGSATILSGGTMEGATESTPGEWRGGTPRGGTRQVIRAGDVITTPAGTPHQMILARGERISYIAIKVAAVPTK